MVAATAVSSSGACAGPSHRFCYHRPEELEVRPAGNFGHDPAKSGMDIGLAADHGRKHVMAVLDHGGRRFVAGGLYGQDSHSGSSSAFRRACTSGECSSWSHIM